MYPILFEFGSVKISAYGFFIAAGYLAGLMLGRALARARGLPIDPFMDIAFLAILSGVVGGRVLFVLTQLEYFKTHPGEIFAMWNGGLVFYGGFLLAAPVCLAYGRWKKLPLALSTDIVVTSVALAHAFGRIGCFMAGCCYGSYCELPWGIRLESELINPTIRGRPLHPVQLYEALFLFLLTGALAWLIRRKQTKPGTVALIYVGGYALARFLLELVRGDPDRGFVAGSPISTSQAVALALFCFSSGALVRRLRGQNL